MIHSLSEDLRGFQVGQENHWVCYDKKAKMIYEGPLSLSSDTKQPEGQGMGYFVEGIQYQGPFLQGKPHGSGTLMSRDDYNHLSKIQVDWVNGSIKNKDSLPQEWSQVAKKIGQ